MSKGNWWLVTDVRLNEFVTVSCHQVSRYHKCKVFSLSEMSFFVCYKFGTRQV